MPTDQEMIATLDRAGCKARDATCVHKTFHGEKTEPGAPQKGRIYCGFAFDMNGTLLNIYRLDPSTQHQPDLRELWADRLRAGSATGAPMTAIEQAKAELVKVKADADAKEKERADAAEVASIRAATARELDRIRALDRDAHPG